jgi:hypothetical protein
MCVLRVGIRRRGHPVTSFSCFQRLKVDSSVAHVSPDQKPILDLVKECGREMRITLWQAAPPPLWLVQAPVIVLLRQYVPANFIDGSCAG